MRKKTNKMHVKFFLWDRVSLLYNLDLPQTGYVIFILPVSASWLYSQLVEFICNKKGELYLTFLFYFISVYLIEFPF